MKRIITFLIVFVLGFVACYTWLNPDWFRGIGLGGVKMAANDCARVEREIEKYDWDTKLATAVMKAESKCDLNVKGDTDLVFEENEREYGYSVGVFQIRILPGREACDTFDLETNVRCAYDIYIKAGREFTDWSMFLNGKYLEYLESD